MIFKRKIQAYNRIPIPEPIMDSLGLKAGDVVQIVSDNERMYIQSIEKPTPHIEVIFDRDKGITSISNKRNEPITRPLYKKIIPTEA